jgi:hypothetical protein
LAHFWQDLDPFVTRNGGDITLKIGPSGAESEEEKLMDDFEQKQATQSRPERMRPESRFNPLPARKQKEPRSGTEQRVGEKDVEIFAEQEGEMFFSGKSAKLIVHAARAEGETDDSQGVLMQQKSN